MRKNKFMLMIFIFIIFLFLIKIDAKAFNGNILIPHKLNPGDKICVLEPSRTNEYRFNLMKERLPIVVNKLKNRGFKVEVYENSFTKTPLGLGEGSENLRADCFNKAVKDPEIKAIFSFWGGYGAMHLLDKLDYEAFRANNKIFVGFSDATAIELAIFQKAGVITFHGPMMGASLNYQETKTFDNLFEMLMKPKVQTELYNIDDNSPFVAYKSGISEGEIVGGNICLIQSLMATPYEPNYKDKILFFEEINAGSLEMHRILWQLKLAKRLDNYAGVVIGEMTPAQGETEASPLSACFDVLKDINIPIIYNVHAGHIHNPLTIPIGAKVKIQNNKLLVTQPVVN